MFKSPLLRKLTFELLPAAALSFTGSILVAQYFRPAVVVTPPSNEISVRDELIRTLQQERAIILDHMTRIAATNAFNAAARHPTDAEAIAQSNSLKTAGIVTSPASRNVQPRPQLRTTISSEQRLDEPKRSTRAKRDKSEAAVVSNAAIQRPITIVPDIQQADDDDDKVSVFNVVSRPLERTGVWLKTLKSKIADQFSISSANEAPRFPGHGIY